MQNHLTTKEVMLLEDQLAHEQLMIEKYRHYSDIAQANDVKQMCGKIADKHQNHLDRLLDYLQASTKDRRPE